MYATNMSAYGRCNMETYGPACEPTNQALWAISLDRAWCWLTRASPKRGYLRSSWLIQLHVKALQLTSPISSSFLSIELIRKTCCLLYTWLCYCKLVIWCFIVLEFSHFLNPYSINCSKLKGMIWLFIVLLHVCSYPVKVSVEIYLYWLSK